MLPILGFHLYYIMEKAKSQGQKTDSRWVLGIVRSGSTTKGSMRDILVDGGRGDRTVLYLDCGTGQNCAPKK